MDSLTHIVLGATLGEAMAGSKLQKRAMLLGAIAQSLPDIDFIASFWSDPAADLLAHRGFTHSFLFVILAAPSLAWFAKWRNQDEAFSFQSWTVFFAVQLLIHDFLDSFNAYGTGWLEPFAHTRFAFNALFVADPLFTIWLIISTIALLITRDRVLRIRWTRFGLILSVVYLTTAITNKLIVDNAVQENLDAQSIGHEKYFSTPTPFNSLLWFVVAQDHQGYHLGYRSVFDDNRKMTFQYFSRNDSLLDPVRNSETVKRLIRFSQGYYVVGLKGDSPVFNDLRFGQMGGWDNPAADFVFHYYLKDPDQNKMVLQRGRFSKWNSEGIRSFLNRLIGNR